MAIGTLAPLRRLYLLAPSLMLLLALFLLLDSRSAHAQEVWHVDNSVDDGLVALWQFDDPVAVPTIYDLVGGNHGNAIGATVVITSNRPPLLYSGSGVLDLRTAVDYVVVPDDAALNTSGEFTLAAWVYRLGPGSTQTIFDSGTQANDWRLYLSTANRLVFDRQGLTTLVSAAVIPLATWTHVAVVVSTGGTNVELFVNGVSSGTAAFGAIPAPAGPKYIGASSLLLNLIPPVVIPQELFDGFLDEMHFYDRALSAAEVGLLADGNLCLTDGTTWESSFRFLECTQVATATGDQVWIGAGTYLPSAARQLPLFLEHGVGWYGGFLGLSPGGGESAIAQRPPFDPEAPLTVITGDLMGDDLPLDASPDPFANHDDNIRILLRGDSFEDHVLDGLELRGANANGASTLSNSGGAINEIGISLTLTNIVFRQNRANQLGGALYSESELFGENLYFIGNHANVRGGAAALLNSATLTATTFVSNTANQLAGALYAQRDLHISDSSFRGNLVEGTSAEGGALGLLSSAPISVSIVASTFVDNKSNTSGAMSIDGQNGNPKTAFVRIENSLFANNVASFGIGSPTALDGDDMRMFDLDLTLLHNTFAGSNGAGPSIVFLRSTGDLRYNIFDSQQVAFHSFDNSVIDEDSNLFVGNSVSTSNGGVVNAGGNSIDGDPQFIDVDGENFRIAIDSDARELANGSTTFTDFEGDVRPIGLAADAGYDESLFANPVANAGGPFSLNERGSLALDGSASSDQDNAITQWSWDCTNDGSFEHNSATPTGNSCIYADNGLFTLRLRAEDATGLDDQFTTTVTVNNVAPSVTPATAQTATAGVSKAFSFGSFTDPGPDAPWEVRVNWGDGTADSVFDVASVGALAPQNHTYAAVAIRTVTVTVTDKDGGAQSKTFQVTVSGGGNNGSPTPETPTPVTPTPVTPTPEATPVVYLPAIQGK